KAARLGGDEFLVML
ncbi:hypothetical protein MKD33_16245, partial [Chromobacterium piscinae]